MGAIASVINARAGIGGFVTLQRKRAPASAEAPNLDLVDLKAGGDVDGVTLFERHIGLLHVFACAHLAAEALDLAFGDGRVHGLHLDTKESFDSFFDHWLVRFHRHFENDSVLLGLRITS